MNILEENDLLKDEFGRIPVNEDEIPLSDMSEDYLPDEETNGQEGSK